MPRIIPLTISSKIQRPFFCDKTRRRPYFKDAKKSFTQQLILNGDLDAYGAVLREEQDMLRGYPN